MYESAASRIGSLEPLWHVGKDRMLFAGCLTRNALHSHSTAVLLAGLYDDFALKVGTEAWVACRTAVIRAGTPYEFDAGGQPLAVLYVEPSAVSIEGLAALMRGVREVPGALIGKGGELAAIRALYEDPRSPQWVEPAISDLVAFSNAKARRHVDRRVVHALDRVACDDDEESGDATSPSVTAAARAAGLSTSRFQHVFKAEVGVSYHRYRAWLRMRRAVRHVVEGHNLTMAAHGAGYYDQPHFAREFRRIFGAPASRSLRNVRR